MEGTTDSLAIEFAPGQPIAWALGGAVLLDCRQLAEVVGHTGGRDTQPATPLAEDAEIELAAIAEAESKRLLTIRATVSLDDSDLVVQLEPLVAASGAASETGPECAKDGNRTAVLVTGDGLRRGIGLPAQLRLAGERIGNGLTLEFRGGLRVGSDLMSSRQPLLTRGRVTLTAVRSPWLPQALVDPQFDIESRDLGLGDKVTIAPPSTLDLTVGDTARGFVRVVLGERTTEMSVYAAALASDAVIVRPYSLAERPKARLLRQMWADPQLGNLVTIIVALAGFLASLVTLMPSAQSSSQTSGSADNNQVLDR
jgi:hypothetical protein